MKWAVVALGLLFLAGCMTAKPEPQEQPAGPLIGDWEGETTIAEPALSEQDQAVGKLLDIQGDRTKVLLRMKDESKFELVLRGQRFAGTYSEQPDGAMLGVDEVAGMTRQEIEEQLDRLRVSEKTKEDALSAFRSVFRVTLSSDKQSVDFNSDEFPEERITLRKQK